MFDHKNGSSASYDFLIIFGIRSFKISFCDISPEERAYALKIRMKGPFLTLNKMIIKFYQFSKFSDNLGIRSESSHSVVRRSLHPLMKKLTDMAVRGSLHLLLKIRTDSAVR